MNRMLIVGNGFDLEHGLKTTYWDFREYLEENHLDFLIAFEKMYNFYPIDFGDPYVGKDAQRKREETVYNMLWEKFEELMGKPIKKRDIATSITSDMNMREGINLDDLIGKQIFFQYNATTTFELFEMQFSLPSIVGIFNSIFESYEILDNKTKVILGTKDKGQKPFTAILCFASDSDMNEYVKENPDCYENILSKAKFPQDYLE